MAANAISFRLLTFLCCLFVTVISPASADTFCDTNKGDYIINSTYHNNLNTLLSRFSSHTEINYGFYNFSYGQDPDKVYAIGLCTGDCKPDECLKCLNDTRVTLTEDCPNQKEAIGWGQNCMLRYSNRSIFGIVQSEPMVRLYLTLNVTGSVDQFNAVVESLMMNLTRTAASGDSRRKYATGSTSAPNFETINGQAQCTPDLSLEDCTNCLKEAVALIIDCCSGHAGGTVLKPSCRFTFDPYTYYRPTLKLDPDAPPTTPPPSPLPSPFTNNTSLQGKSNTLRTIIAIAVPVASVVLVLTLFCNFLHLYNSEETKKKNSKLQEKKIVMKMK